MYFLDFCKGAYSRGALKNFLVVGQIPVEIFLLRNCFVNATHTSNWIFLKDRQIFDN